MMDNSSKPQSFVKIEWWVLTSIFVLVVLFHFTDAMESNWRNQGSEMIPFDYSFFARLARYVLLYVTFIFLNFRLVPKLINREHYFRNIFLIAMIFFVSAIIWGFTDVHVNEFLYRKFYAAENTGSQIVLIVQRGLFYATWLLLVFATYTGIRYGAIYLLKNSEAIELRYRMITRDALIAFIFWMVSVFLLWVGGAERDILIGWSVLIPYAIFFYCYAFYSMIPAVLGKKYAWLRYVGRTVLVLLVSYFVVAILVLVFIREDDVAFEFSFFNTLFQFFITAPLTLLLYKRQRKGTEEMIGLKKELGQTHAHFDFLRSQINPHFLFNALNTIYGTAIQENASRTSEGIEKLGDMMRFMLQENMKEKISLTREIEYLNNYISLQRLRTDTHPNITIQTSIEEKVHLLHIAPMLLIPFVENAFKHGISFREPSHIKVTLEVRNNTLYFDVFNSKHSKVDKDPEKDKSGIGLENVKQRLQLLYPDKHDLIIRETGKEFYVHLTISDLR